MQALTATEIKKSAKKEKGYWNYEIINKKVKAKTPLPKAPPPPVAMPTNELLMQLHPDQIKILVQTWRKHAVHTMNPHDVSEALRIQDVARKKSAAYAAVVGFVIQQNPNLTLADEVPITNAGKQAQFDRRELAMNKLILRYEKHYGLLYFTSKTCEYCRIQDGVLTQFLHDFNYTIKTVELQKNSKLALKFNIKQTPSIILVNKRTKKWIPVTFGASSLPSFKENVYRGIRYIQKEITPAQFFTNESDMGTGLDPTNKQE
ncbi:glutaredoxin [Bathymodiolus azoricus thioautotrophic gill symbiont]|uniref:Glutaredoxin n=2 Tax=sulfur-oxidizing symbionts TaxID=32036 RepID=A0A1H6IXY8_9GAMM|nr:glutaredoxin [Bathymodiolus azoricus thioautotrophic gill symbiont]